MKIKHIIWDWNGTLLDDVWLSVTAMNVVLKRHGLTPITREKYLDIFTFPVIDYYRTAGFDFTTHPFEIVGTEFIREYTRRQTEPALHNGAVEILSGLSANGVTHSLLSAAAQPMLDTLIRHHRIDRCFLKLIGQNNHYAYGKTEAGRQWLNVLDYDPTDILFVGDTLHDRDVARELGVSCALISAGHASPERLRASGADVYSDLAEFARNVFNLTI